MKTSKVIVSMLIVLFLVGIAVMAFAKPPMTVKKGWPNQQGEICLKVYADTNTTAPALGEVSMYVTKMGDGHYLVLGRHEEVSGEVVPFIGSAVMVDGMIKIHITASGIKLEEGSDPGDVHGNMTTMMLDPVSLEGTFESLDLMCEKEQEINHLDYIYGDDYDVGWSGIKFVSPCQ